MTTKTANMSKIESLRAQAARASENAAKQSAAAQAAAHEQMQIEAALAAHREKGSMQFHQEYLRTSGDTRLHCLEAIADARKHFREVVNAGEPFMAAFLAIKQAEHELAICDQIRDFAIFKTKGSASPAMHRLPETTLTDELNAAVQDQISDLQEIHKTAIARVTAIVDEWCDANPVDLTEGVA